MGQRLCAGFGGEKASGAPWGPLLMPTPSAQLTRGALTPAEGSEGAGLLYAVLFFFFPIYPFPGSYLAVAFGLGKKRFK